MRKPFIICLLLLLVLGANGQAIKSLPADQEADIKDICLLATSSSFAIDVKTASEDLSTIYKSLGLLNENIEVISCDKLKNSALAYWDDVENRYYILVNENKLTNLSGNYYSHMFVVAHEYAHIKKNHLGRNIISTNPNKRQLELEADEYAARIIKSLSGKEEDCIFALNAMRHPVDDSFSDHPTFVKRVEAVRRGFEASLIEKAEKNYVDLLKDYDNASLLSYKGELTKYDITSYSSDANVVPASIINYADKYWIYYIKDEKVKNYCMFWNYQDFPSKEIQEYMNKGYNVKFIDKINKTWFVVMHNNGQLFAQNVTFIKKEIFQQDIKKYLSDGFSVFNMIDNGSYYVVLLNKRANGSGYAWAFRNTYEDFEKWYKERSKEGFNYMTCFKKIDNTYFGFMKDEALVSSWTVLYLRDDKVAKLQELLEDGYVVDNITYDEGMRFTLKK